MRRSYTRALQRRSIEQTHDLPSVQGLKAGSPVHVGNDVIALSGPGSLAEQPSVELRASSAADSAVPVGENRESGDGGVHVVLDQSPQMFFVQHDDRVEQLAAAASHPALCDAILPGRYLPIPRRGELSAAQVDYKDQSSVEPCVVWTDS